MYLCGYMLADDTVYMLFFYPLVHQLIGSKNTDQNKFNKKHTHTRPHYIVTTRSDLTKCNNSRIQATHTNIHTHSCNHDAKCIRQ